MMIRCRGGRCCLAATLVCLFAIVSSGVAFGSGVVGTYLVEEDSGAKSLWTFAVDGNLFITSSTQPSLLFSNQQGAWRYTGLRRVTAVSLDFSFDEDNAWLNTARVDAWLTCDDADCSTISGAITIRFFEEGEDPLDPSTDTGEELTDTFEGRRITIERTGD